jgi:hypothetical protein
MPQNFTRDIVSFTEPCSTKNIKDYANELKAKKVIIDEVEEE